MHAQRVYPRLSPCPWRNQSEPCPCCGGAQTTTACCPGEKVHRAPGKHLESGCCWIESFSEVHQQGWGLQWKIIQDKKETLFYPRHGKWTCYGSSQKQSLLTKDAENVQLRGWRSLKLKQKDRCASVLTHTCLGGAGKGGGWGQREGQWVGHSQDRMRVSPLSFLLHLLLLHLWGTTEEHEYNRTPMKSVMKSVRCKSLYPYMIKNTDFKVINWGVEILSSWMGVYTINHPLSVRSLPVCSKRTGAKLQQS